MIGTHVIWGSGKGARRAWEGREEILQVMTFEEKGQMNQRESQSRKKRGENGRTEERKQWGINETDR